MRNHSIFKSVFKWGATLCFLGVVSCSHTAYEDKSEEGSETSDLDKAADTGGGFDEGASGGGGSGAGGVLNFFGAGAERGLVVRGIRWDRPLGSENPGADCELKRKTAAPVYNCVVREQGEAVVLTIHEEIAGDNRHLKKITLDGKGVETRDRWTELLKSFGYTRSGLSGGRPGRTGYVSSDKKTEVQIVWAPSAEAVTLIFGPRSRGGHKGHEGSKQKKHKAGKAQ